MGLGDNLKNSSASISAENDSCGLITNFMEVLSERDDVAKTFCENLYKKANMVIYNQFGVEECFSTSEWRSIERITAGLKIMQAIGNRVTDKNIQLAKKIGLP